MPVQQGNAGFSVGRDCRIVVMHPAAPGGRIDIPNVTGFDCKQVADNISVKRMDGVRLTADLPVGWDGQFDAERGSSGVDDLFSLIDQTWKAAGVYQQATIYQYVDEVDGSTSTYQLTDVSMMLADAGHFQGDQTVKQRVTFRANMRNRL